MESLRSWHRLLDGCYEAQVPRVVVASSAHVYGLVDGLAREDLAVTPMSPYAVTKLAAERLALACGLRADSKMSVVAVRVFTAYGERSHPTMVVPSRRDARRTADSGRLLHRHRCLYAFGVMPDPVDHDS